MASGRGHAPSPLSAQNRALSPVALQCLRAAGGGEPQLPLLDRLRFGSIASSSLDGFCRARRPLVSRLNADAGKGHIQAVRELLNVVRERTAQMHSELERTTMSILGGSSTSAWCR